MSRLTGWATRQAARDLLAHAWPVLIAQLASIGMMAVDTAVLGHVSAEDLAAVAIGGGIHVSIMFALIGVLQAIAPLAAHARGAGDEAGVLAVLHQGIWLAGLLCLPGIALLLHPGVLLGLVTLEPVVEVKVRQYLALLAWGLPPALCYRACYIFCNALGRPRVLMLIGIVALGLHAVLAWGWAAAGWLGEPLGVLGCAAANVLIALLACFTVLLYLRFGPMPTTQRLFAAWPRPDLALWRRLLRLGLPMGVSNFVEISAFTLVALFIASLGATVVAGHRIVANFSALTYMLPLSLGIATLSALGQALGARDVVRAGATIRAALYLAGTSSAVLGLALWLAAAPLVALYTDDTQVRAVAVSLVIYIAIYQFFDALQTIAGHALRAYHVTFVPMLIQTFCFWGVGLLGGAALCFRWSPPLGVTGFWVAAMTSLILAAAMLLPMLFKVARVAAQEVATTP